MAINAGDRDWQKYGALSFFGEPEILAGEFAGTELNELGAKHALCITPRPGSDPARGPLQRARHRSSAARPRTSSPTAPTSRTYVSTVSSKLRQDPSIDSVVTLDASLGVAVQQQLEQDGNTAKVATYAFNNDLIPLLQNGKVAFTIDQQPYLQGYLSIDSLWLYKKNKSVIGAQQSVPTGPVVIDQSNIGDIAQDVTSGLR